MLVSEYRADWGISDWGALVTNNAKTAENLLLSQACLLNLLIMLAYQNTFNYFINSKNKLFHSY